MYKGVHKSLYNGTELYIVRVLFAVLTHLLCGFTLRLYVCKVYINYLYAVSAFCNCNMLLNCILIKKTTVKKCI